MNIERKAELVCVDPKKVRQIWHVAEPMISAGYEASGESVPADLLERIENIHVLLWLAVIDGKTITAAMTTQLEARKDGLVCRLVSAGGSMLPAWRGLIAKVEEYARAEGCVKIESEGRPGWERALPGFRRVRVVIEKRL